MIRADVEWAVALAQGTNLRASVWAGIVEGADLSPPVPHEEDFLPPYPGHQEIVRVGKLAVQGKEHPSPFEQILHLQIEDLLIGKYAAMNARYVLRRFEIHHFHRTRLSLRR